MMNPKDIGKNAEIPAPTTSVRGYVLIAYGLFLVAMWTGFALSFGSGGLVLNVLGLIAVGILMTAGKILVGTIYESHGTWLKRTFVLTLAGFVVGIALLSFDLTFLLGNVLVMGMGLYYIYRVFKGFRAFSQARPIENPRGWI